MMITSTAARPDESGPRFTVGGELVKPDTALELASGVPDRQAPFSGDFTLCTRVKADSVFPKTAYVVSLRNALDHSAFALPPYFAPSGPANGWLGGHPVNSKTTFPALRGWPIIFWLTLRVQLVV